LPAEVSGKRFADPVFDLPRARACKDRLTHGSVTHTAHQRGEDLQVVQGKMRRRGDHEQKMDGLAVRGIERDPRARKTKPDQHAGEPLDPPVGNRHPVAEAG